MDKVAKTIQEISKSSLSLERIAEVHSSTGFNLRHTVRAVREIEAAELEDTARTPHTALKQDIETFAQDSPIVEELVHHHEMETAGVYDQFL